ncbi:MAG TPA: MBL fold metallo-hydrolase [Candidatus Paceibacterota bacterium]|nr:MBL fold metallo-hydrolase [Candidatus Paceibacterota bacterium]
MSSKIHFYGAAGTVTGSNFLLNTGDTKILIDCGLSQGRHAAEDANWQKFPFNPSEIDFLLVTHAHIDHIGRIPKLVKDGFKGKILSTQATKTIAPHMLRDSMELLAHEARRHNREILYTEADIDNALKMWEGTEYHTKHELGSTTVLFLDAGHILGSAMIHITRNGRNLVFTGDLGAGNSPLLGPTEALSSPHYLVMESVYGDRIRGRDDERRELLEDIIEHTAARGGTLLIPAFSTERTQDLLYEIKTLMTQKKVPSMPVYVDSPLSQKITAAYLSCKEYFAPDIQARIDAGENIFEFPELRFVEEVEESRKIAAERGPKIVLAGSGMSNGGRVHEHERHVLPDEQSTLLIVGYQSAGSLGRKLLEGEKRIKIRDETILVRARVEAIYGYSAHMDGEQLLEFVNKSTDTLKNVFVVMGEPASASFLVQRIRDYLGVKAVAPEEGEEETIDF